MSVSARVHCNCFERGIIRCAPYPDLLYIDESGAMAWRSLDGGLLAQLDEWRRNACEHERGIYVSRDIGNIALVANLRRELSREQHVFPVLLEKVLYNGIHAGDCLSLEDVDLLRLELEVLKDFQPADSELIPYLQSFAANMFELVQCAQLLEKPIEF